MKENEISGKIIAAAVEVHRTLGPGLLESLYHACMEEEFRSDGLEFEREKLITLFYKERELRNFLRLDFLVERLVVVEIKSVEVLLPVHKAQLLSYLRLTEHRLGLLINFNSPVLRTGIKRIVNNL